MIVFQRPSRARRGRRGDCNNLNLNCSALWDLTDELSFVGELPKPPLDAIVAFLNNGSRAFIAHVRNKSHFVLLNSYDAGPGMFNVNDPFYNTSTYAYDDIADIIMYDFVTPIADAVIPHGYPLYKQCDSRWGDELMVHISICTAGCLMSSTSMALGGHNIAVTGQESNPGTLNAWLQQHGG